MPRGGPPTYTYSLPAIYLAIPGTLITAAQHNAPLEDLANTMNIAWPVNLGGTGGTTEAALLAAQNRFTATQSWDKGADIPSASSLTLGVDGNFFHVTGTTTITAISTEEEGTWIVLEFDGALTLTHNATSLILPHDGQNIVTAAGDTALLVSEGSGNWRCVAYQKAIGTAVNQAWEQIGPIRNDSGVASITWTDLSAYRELRIRGTVRPATSNANVQMRFSTDNGSNWISADYIRLVTTAISNSLTSTVENDSLTFALLNTIAGVSNVTEMVLSQIDLFNFNQSRIVYYHYKTSYVNAAGSVEYLSSGAGRNTGTTARDALQIYASAGNISAFGLVLEGLRG